MKCASCDLDFNDGVQCGVCRRNLDFGCGQIAETSWRKLGSSKRAAWKCPLCRAEASSTSAKPSRHDLEPPSSAAPSPVRSSAAGDRHQHDPVTLDLLYREIQGIKSNLSGLPTLFADVRSIKDELADLKASHSFNSDKLDDLAGKTAEVDRRVVELERELSAHKSELAVLRAQSSASEQRSRLNNVEIKGVPTKKDENLFEIVGSVSKKVNFILEKAQINYIYRVPTHTSKEKSIIVSFLNRYVKEDFVAAARAHKSLTAADFGFDGTQRIFVNDHLSAESKNLLTKCKIKAKEKNYNYVWVKFGKIHVRKNDTSPILILSKDSDLNKIS